MHAMCFAVDLEFIQRSDGVFGDHQERRVLSVGHYDPQAQSGYYHFHDFTSSIARVARSSSHWNIATITIAPRTVAMVNTRKSIYPSIVSMVAMGAPTVEVQCARFTLRGFLRFGGFRLCGFTCGFVADPEEGQDLWCRIPG